jgi:hypothetical protein
VLLCQLQVGNMMKNCFHQKQHLLLMFAKKYIPVLSGSVILKYVVGMLDWSTIKLAKSVEVEICNLYETTFSFSGSVAGSHIKVGVKVFVDE